MKNSTFIIVTAFLGGIALFGFFKSLALFKHNFDLNQSVGRLTIDLQSMETSLKATKQALSDSYLKNTVLEGDLKESKTLLDKKENQIKESLDNIQQLTQKLKEIAATNENLTISSKEIQDRALRSELEMDEVKRKLSSLVELRKAIRELKIKIREQRAQKSSIPSQSQSEEKQPVAQPELIQEIESAPKDGNHGFIVKDGKLVVEDFVDINVVPADARAL